MTRRRLPARRRGGPDTMVLRIEEGPEGPRVWLSHDRIELLMDGFLTL